MNSALSKPDNWDKWVKRSRVPDICEEAPESMIQELSLEANKVEVPEVEIVACDATIEDWQSRNGKNFAYSS